MFFDCQSQRKVIEKSLKSLTKVKEKSLTSLDFMQLFLTVKVKEKSIKGMSHHVTVTQDSGIIIIIIFGNEIIQNTI